VDVSDRNTAGNYVRRNNRPFRHRDTQTSERAISGKAEIGAQGYNMSCTCMHCRALDCTTDPAGIGESAQGCARQPWLRGKVGGVSVG
jgi:hypothetical protein